MSFLETCWEEREEKIYKDMFGFLGKGIYPLSVDIFNRMKADSVDPRWLNHGVFACPPFGKRKTWTYVTSGMSNPWEADAPEDYSGMGVEFVMETDSEESWAIEVLQTLMAYNLMLAAGKMGNFPPLDYGHRVPLALSESIRTMMFVKPLNFPASFSLKSGSVDVLQVVGITFSELAFAKETSSEQLRDIMVSATGNLILQKERKSFV